MRFLVDFEVEKYLRKLSTDASFSAGGGGVERSEHVGNICSAATSNSTSLTFSAKMLRGAFFFFKF